MFQSQQALSRFVAALLECWPYGCGAKGSSVSSQCGYKIKWELQKEQAVVLGPHKLCSLLSGLLTSLTILGSRPIGISSARLGQMVCWDLGGRNLSVGKEKVMSRATSGGGQCLLGGGRNPGEAGRGNCCEDSGFWAPGGLYGSRQLWFCSRSIDMKMTEWIKMVRIRRGYRSPKLASSCLVARLAARCVTDDDGGRYSLRLQDTN